MKMLPLTWSNEILRDAKPLVRCRQDTNHLKVQLQRALSRNDRESQRILINQVLSYMINGANVSNLLNEMIMASDVDDLMQKKLVYHYLSHFQGDDESNDFVLMMVNTIQKDFNHVDPLIREMSIRASTYFSSPLILPYLIGFVQDAWKDANPRVVSTAVMGWVKMISSSNELGNRISLDLSPLRRLIKNHDPLICYNVLCALEECMDYWWKWEGILDQSIISHLIDILPRSSIWARSRIIHQIDYAIGSEELVPIISIPLTLTSTLNSSLTSTSTSTSTSISSPTSTHTLPLPKSHLISLLNRLDPLLDTPNVTILLAVGKLLLTVASYLPNLQLPIITRIHHLLIDRLPWSSQAMTWIILKHIHSIQCKHPKINNQQIASFLWQPGDGECVAKMKIRILLNQWIEHWEDYVGSWSSSKCINKHNSISNQNFCRLCIIWKQLMIYLRMEPIIAKEAIKAIGTCWKVSIEISHRLGKDLVEEDGLKEKQSQITELNTNSSNPILQPMASVFDKISWILGEVLWWFEYGSEELIIHIITWLKIVIRFAQDDKWKAMLYQFWSQIPTRITGLATKYNKIKTTITELVILCGISSAEPSPRHNAEDNKEEYIDNRIEEYVEKRKKYTDNIEKEYIEKEYIEKYNPNATLLLDQYHYTNDTELKLTLIHMAFKMYVVHAGVEEEMTLNEILKAARNDNRDALVQMYGKTLTSALIQDTKQALKIIDTRLPWPLSDNNHKRNNITGKESYVVPKSDKSTSPHTV